MKRKFLVSVMAAVLLLSATIVAYAAGPSIANIDLLDTGAWGSFYVMEGTLKIDGTNNLGGEDNTLQCIASYRYAGVDVKEFFVDASPGLTGNASKSNVSNRSYRAIGDPHGVAEDGCHGKITVSDIG